MAEQVRSYDRHRDFEYPDPVQPRLAQWPKAREPQALARFLSLCLQAPESYEPLRMQLLHHHSLHQALTKQSLDIRAGLRF